MNVIAIAIGGVIGAILRYFISLLLAGAPVPFFIDTLLVNVLGCFLLGLVLTKFQSPSPIRLGIGTGLVGSYTTFSTFSVEVVELMNDSLLHAFIYIVSSILTGLLATAFGIYLGTGRRCSR